MLKKQNDHSHEKKMNEYDELKKIENDKDNWIK